VRLEGKIDRIVDKMDHQNEETMRVRDRVHEMANDLTPLVMLNIPDKIADFQGRITSLESDREQRKGAMIVVRGLWALAGFICGGGVIGIIQYAGGGS